MKSVFRSKALIAIAVGSLYLTPKAEAALILTFVEVGPDVVATLSGSLSFSGATPLHDNAEGTASTILQGVSGSFFYYPAGVPYDVYQISPLGSSPSKSATSTTLTTPIGWGGGGFGDPSYLIVDSSASTNGSVSPRGTFTWSGETLDSIGMSYLKTIEYGRPLRVYGSGDEVRFVAAPEPSGFMLFGIGAFGWLIRRRVR